MPAIVGPIKITDVDSSAVVHFGDSLYVSPKSTGKAFLGSGSVATGDFIIVNNGLSVTNTLDTDVVDNSVFGNN